jgi:FlaA1/EpsC-like NDP-sugar epimerase
MHTLSAGQATRARFGIFPDPRAALAGLRRKADAIDSSIVVLLAETVFAMLAYALAVFLLAQALGSSWAIETLRSTLVLAGLFGLAASASLRLYRRSLRYPSALDAISIAEAVFLNIVLLGGLIWWRFAQLKIPTAVFVVDAMFLLLFWGALHFGARVRRMQEAARRTHGKRAVIVGAGDAGITVLKELALDPTSPCRPVAVVDDDTKKWGRTLYGVPILGGTKNLDKIAAETQADEILICIPSATHSQMHDILDASRRSNLPVRSLPSLAELIRGAHAGKVSPRDLRSSRIEFLLQREENRVEAHETRKIVGGKVVLVTGAGGSIGSELCRQIAPAGPRKMLLLDKSENGLFYVNLESSERLGADRVKPFLADLLDIHRLRRILRDERPEVVFHAAAHKHVAMLERYPQEAIRNNVLGTRNIAAAALECGARRFVNISTDKAVDPRNYMGLSKKLTELCIQEFARSVARTGGTRFSNVRFGNVAGSTGSVLRLFWDQIQKGGPVRVTDPSATRYFMTIPEAVHLILRAAALGRGGETFVFDMGEPLNIYELAKTMMLFAGLKPHEDLPIEFIGLRDGEKVSEELWENWEHPIPAGYGRILVIREKDARARGILPKIRKMEEFLARDDSEGLLEYLHGIFSEFGAERTKGLPRPALMRASKIATLSSLGAA